MGHEGHDHGHDKDHHHEPPPSTAEGPSRDRAKRTWRPDLPRGVGEGKVLFLDAPSGLAGDMVIAALVDLGVPPAVVADAAAALPVAGYHVHFGSRVRSGIVASHFDVHVDAAQPERTYGAVKALLAKAKLAP